MELLESILTLTRESGKRELARTHVYAVVLRVALFLTDVLKPGDSIQHEGRTYAMLPVQVNGKRTYVVTVNNGRGNALLGTRVQTHPFIPHASYDEHLLFAEHVHAIIDKFGALLQQEVRRSESAEHETISELSIMERIV